ncbi:MAG TPA: LysM peptidoglycan-binding domain-containing protein [Gemmatimonadales bacterium]|nr:LysM peptidoglycan-binding domain-containing protein [Gemmatimonadales bacterium]
MAVPAVAGSTSVVTASPVASADSAADAEVLEELRGAAPAEGAADERGNPAPTGGAEATDAAVVTWDIDVTSFLSHERVQYYLDFFQGPARERFGAWLQRMPRYEPMIRARLARQGLPGDLLYLALIESGFSNSATSRARAVGMWQFMPSTGRQYGLRVDRWVDERRDPVKATDAAARHLDDLRERFGSLYLAAAAYNAGGGKVSKGLRRLGDGPEDEGAEEDLTSDSTFFLLYDTRYLRRETKDYVPKLIAAAIIAKEPEKYGFPRPAELPPFAYDSIVVPDATGLDVVARLAGTDVAALRDLNPQFLRLITPPGARAVVRLPVGTGERTAAAFAELPANRRVTFKEHVVRSGETLGAIGKRYGVGVADIRSANRNIAPNRLRIGMTLIIPVSPAFDPRAVAATEAPAPGRRGAGAPGRSSTTWHAVRRGESWWSIGERYGVRVGDLQAWNDAGPREKLRIGQRVRVRPGRSGAVAQGRSTSAAPTTPARAATAARPATYRVKRGDTLSEIASRNGTTVTRLRQLNRLPANGVLQTGETLKLR